MLCPSLKSFWLAPAMAVAMAAVVLVESRTFCDGVTEGGIACSSNRSSRIVPTNPCCVDASPACASDPAQGSYFVGDDSRSGHRYFVATDSVLSWWDAYGACEALCAELTTIESEDELDFLNDLLRLSGLPAMDAFWTAGNQLTIEDVWMWGISGCPVRAWWPTGSGQPDDDGGLCFDDDCINLRQVTSSDGTPPPRRLVGDHPSVWIMNDDTCSFPNQYICRKKLPGKAYAGGGSDGAGNGSGRGCCSHIGGDGHAAKMKRR